MSKFKFAIYIGIFLLAVGITFYWLSGSSGGSANGIEVDWKLLGELDYISGKASSELAALEGKDVKIPGFMVPLEDNAKEVSEFLLVPSPQACIHVPPPPPNQMVLIEMEKGSGAQTMFGPIWVYGKLSMTPKRHQYGVSSFSMKGTHIEQYR